MKNKVDRSLLAKNEKGGIEVHYVHTLRQGIQGESRPWGGQGRIKGEKMIQELATLYRVHPNLVALWKKQLQENAPELFERTQKDKKKEVAQHKEEELYK